MAMTHERLAVSSGLHTILTNYRFSGSPNLQNPQPTTSLLEKKMGCTPENQHGSFKSHPFAKENNLVQTLPFLVFFWSFSRV